MKTYILSLGAGILAGAIYALLNVRSPAPPTIALLGLLGMLIGERAVTLAKAHLQRQPVTANSSTSPEIAALYSEKDPSAKPDTEQ